MAFFGSQVALVGSFARCLHLAVSHYFSCWRRTGQNGQLAPHGDDEASPSVVNQLKGVMQGCKNVWWQAP